MFSDRQLERYGRVMVWALETARSSSGAVFAPGEVVHLRYDALAGPLAEHVYRELIRKGIHVLPDINVGPNMERIYYEEAGEKQLTFFGPWVESRVSHLNGLVAIRAPESLTHLKDCDPDKMALRSKAGKPLLDIRKDRENQGLFAWTLCDYPTPVLAEQAGMTLDEYAEQVALACYLDDADPVATWTETMAMIDKVKAWLTGLDIDHVHVMSDDGETDLKVWIGERRRWLGGSGHNIPSFEVFVTPEAGRAEGIYHASEPSFRSGRYVRGARLEFRGGEVVNATAEAEEDYLRSRVALDDGSRLLGEFSLTDRRFSRITRFMASTLYDENVGGDNGNCHVAIGRGFQDSIRLRKGEEMTPELAKEMKVSDSSEHWDLITTTPRQVVAYLKDGTGLVIYENGQFTLDL